MVMKIANVKSLFKGRNVFGGFAKREPEPRRPARVPPLHGRDDRLSGAHAWKKTETAR